jgi:hypothetical protein
MRNRIARWATRLLHPHPRFPFLPLHMLSPADAVAERLGTDAVDRTFQRPEVTRLARAFVRFLDDEEAERALRKELHAVYEQRLRAVALTMDPPGSHGFDSLSPGPLGHPLDAAALADLLPHLPEGTKAPAIPAPPRLLQWFSLFSVAAITLGGALGVLLLHGRARVEPRHARVAAPNFWTIPSWRHLKDAAAENGLWRGNDLLFVLEHAAHVQVFRDSGFPCMDPAQPVPAGDWLVRVAGPAVALTVRSLWAAALKPADPLVLEVAARTLNLAARALKVWRMAFSLRCRWFLECADDSSLPILRAAILRKFGGASVRWPYSQNESPGIHLSYLGFDLYLSGGELQAAHYRSSWRTQMRTLAIGQVRSDRRYSITADPSIAAAIAGRIAAGQHMAVYFGGSSGVGFERPMRELARRSLRVLADRPDWFVVIKPKLNDALYRDWEQDSELAALLSAPNVMALHYSRPSVETCAPAWLIPRMALGLTVPGSVVIEALTAGVPCLSYWPVVTRTVLHDRLRADGLEVNDFASLDAALACAAVDPAGLAFDRQWYRWAGDVQGDDRALDRVARTLFADGTASALDS